MEHLKLHTLALPVATGGPANRSCVAEIGLSDTCEKNHPSFKGKLNFAGWNESTPQAGRSQMSILQAIKPNAVPIDKHHENRKDATRWMGFDGDPEAMAGFLTNGLAEWPLSNALSAA